MNKLLYFSLLVFVISCTSPIEENTEEFGIISPDNVVKIEITTEEPNDEIFINYYVYQTDSYDLQLYPFTYDSQGNANPIVITLNNYDFRYIQGETYRNRVSSNIPLTLKLYLNDEIIVEEKSVIDEKNTNARITFNYDIRRKESI
jgi:hypothetical protein